MQSLVQVLTELELPHVYHTVGRNSPKRIAMREKWDTFQARAPMQVIAIACKSWCLSRAGCNIHRQGCNAGMELAF